MANFEDSSVGHTEDHTPTVYGATIDTTIYKYGSGSGNFTGNSYITFPDSVDWYFGSGAFTISIWFYINNETGFCYLGSRHY